MKPLRFGPFALALATLLCASCKEDAEPITQAIVIVRSDLEIGTELRSLKLELRDPSGEDVFHGGQVIPLVEEDPEDGEQTLPMSFGIVPAGGDASVRFLLNVRGYGPIEEGGRDEEVVRESVLTGFLPGETSVIYVFLSTQCLNKLCESEGGGTLMSCDYQTGMCSDTEYEPPVPIPVPRPTDVQVGELCPPGLERDDGECVDINECEAESDEPRCGDNATCENFEAGYRCVCEDDSVVARDEDCALDEMPVVDGPCDDDPCQAPSECVERGDDFECTCPAGFEPDEAETGCTDIDECALEIDECDPLSTCRNTDGSFVCEDCPAGFEDPTPGMTACENIDECDLDLAECEDGLTCRDLIGSFQCEGCPMGYVDPEPGESRCENIVECEESNGGCDLIATCVDTDGSFECDCPDDTHDDPPEGETECTPIQPACVIRVRATGNDASDGSTWALAKATIHAALAVPDVCEVWVAAGTYKPTRNEAGAVPPVGSEREATFKLVANAGLYGGFAGTETQRSQRNPLANPTVLSGNIGAAGASDNAYHVVTGTADGEISGFFVLGGLADSASPNHNGAGLMHAVTGTVRASDMVFVLNRASYGAGVTSRAGATYEIEDSVFLWNTATAGGGGFGSSSDAAGSITSTTFHGNSGQFGTGAWIYDSNATVRDCTFNSNVGPLVDSTGALDFATPPSTADGHFVYNSTFVNNTAGKGAAVWMDGASPDIIGCSFVNNTSTNTMGAIRGAAVATWTQQGAAAPDLINCLFWNNTQGATIVDITANGGAPFVDGSCGPTDLNAFGGDNANATIAASPFASTEPSGVAYLDQGATDPSCIDVGSSAIANTAQIPWSSLTTAANGALDMTAPDAGRHVSPDAVVITQISATNTMLTWRSRNATSCAWMADTPTMPLAAGTGQAAAAGAAHGSAAGTRLALICTGAEGEPAVATAVVP